MTDPISDDIVRRIRSGLKPWAADITEKKMFGGYCFLYKGKMCVGETRHRLMVRVLADKMEQVLATAHVKPMDFTGKPMKEFIFVSEQGYASEEQLQHWIELGIAHAKSKTE